MTQWSKPIQIRELLDKCVSEPGLLPPVSTSSYILTKHNWQGSPASESIPLYVGGNSVNSNRFRTRVGDLIADMFGFYGGETGHHSGGIFLHEWCQENSVNPLDLYIAWVNNATCFRCVEIDLYLNHHPALNKKRPSKCSQHNRHA